MNTMTVNDYEQCFHRLEAQLSGQSQPWLRAFRRAALEALRQQGLPNRRTEAWKYTPVRQLVQTPLSITANAHLDTSDQLSLPAGLCTVVLVNGQVNERASTLDSLPTGLSIEPLQHYLTERGQDAQERLGRDLDYQGQPFAALNSAFFRDGLMLTVAADTCIEQPVLIVHLTAGATPAIVQSRLLVDVQSGAQACLVEWQPGGDKPHLDNRVLEIDLAAHARLQHFQCQYAQQQQIIGATQVRCGESGEYCGQRVDLGGKLVRNDLRVQLAAPGARCTLSGLCVTGSLQHVDNHICIDHRAPRCFSRSRWHTLLGKQSHTVFNGKIVVQPGADGSDAKLHNANLLLASDCEIDSKPELEIYADDVQCNHGSTVSDLDAERLFYLRSRGIPLVAARQLMIEAFAVAVLAPLPAAGLQTFVHECIEQALAECECGEPVMASKCRETAHA